MRAIQISQTNRYQRVTIDICKVYGSESVFLQQAAHLTGGSYLHLERADALLQYLTVRKHRTPVRLVSLLRPRVARRRCLSYRLLASASCCQYLHRIRSISVQRASATNALSISASCAPCACRVSHCFSSPQPSLIGISSSVFCQPVPVCSTCRQVFLPYCSLSLLCCDIMTSVMFGGPPQLGVRSRAASPKLTVEVRRSCWRTSCGVC